MNWEQRSKELHSSRRLPRWSREQRQAALEAGAIAVYTDGSTVAEEQLRDQMHSLRLAEDNLRTLRAFVQKHLVVLDGSSWEFDSGAWYRPEINISHWYYRGAVAGAERIASLWPDATWHRRKESYPREGEHRYDWVAEIDGVDVVLPNAEVVKLRPRNVPGDGERVVIGAGRCEKEVAA